MGCGCGKQNVQDQSKVVPKGITPIQVVAVQPEEINYTIEEVIKVKDFILSTNRTLEQRKYVQEFMFNSVGFVIPDYCDQICINNLKVKVAEMESKLK